MDDISLHVQKQVPGLAPSFPSDIDPRDHQSCCGASCATNDVECIVLVAKVHEVNFDQKRAGDG